MSKDVVLERLNKLVAKGYVVRWGELDVDTLRLEHPRAPHLTLFSDGRIWVLTPSPEDWVATDNEADQRFQSFVPPNDWIAAEFDQRRFKSFLVRVPKPTTLQAFKAMKVEDVWTRVSVWTFIVVVGLITAFGFGWVWASRLLQLTAKDVVKDGSGQAIAYVYVRETKADADTAKGYDAAAPRGPPRWLQLLSAIMIARLAACRALICALRSAAWLGRCSSRPCPTSPRPCSHALLNADLTMPAVELHGALSHDRDCKTTVRGQEMAWDAGHERCDAAGRA